MNSSSPIQTSEHQTGTRRSIPFDIRRSPLSLIIAALFIAVSGLSILGISVVVLNGRAAASHDFISYWATGQQLVHGQNPYDPQSILMVERSAGFELQDRVLMMRNPPTALFLTIPLGFMPARAASIFWTLLLAACLILSVEILRRQDNGERSNLYLIGYCFAPALANLATGQTGVFSLLGIVLFLRFLKSHPLIAGISLSLCAIKPHLFLPLAAVLLVWIFARKAYSVLVGAVLALASECLVALWFDASVWRHYLTMMRVDGIRNEFVPTLGTLFRFSIHQQAMWLQFMPAVLACAWALYYFYRHRRNWDWQDHAPLLILVSLVTAPYAWFSDQAIGLAAILPTVRPSRKLIPLLALMSAASIEMLAHVSFHSQVYLWQGIAWLAWYLYAAKRQESPPESSGGANSGVKS